jgi:hypothetical protein
MGKGPHMVGRIGSRYFRAAARETKNEVIAYEREVDEG